MTSPGSRPVVFGPTTDRETTTVADILRQETVGGALLLAAAVVALLWANLGPDSYEAVRHFQLGPLDVQHWASDGVLTVFFFVAGMELKRELTVGSLARPAEALVPIVAALAGMVVPAAIYLAVNLPAADGAPRGWAVPMATDIAFALAVLAVVGSRLPGSLRAFLLTLAIVDDLGAITVIAVAYTANLSFGWLAGAVALAALFGLLQWRRVPGWGLYLVVGVGCWWCTLQSGVHATIAGVAVGLLTRSLSSGRSPDPSAPLDRWEHRWRPLSAGFAVPFFALFAAGVQITPAALAGLVRDPVAVGIVAGLVLGKTLGVFGGAYLTARFTRAQLAPDLRWSEVASVSVLAGVGFTVALLISELAFPDDPARGETAKAAVLAGSLLAAVLATVSLRRRVAGRDRAEAPDPDGGAGTH